MIAAMNVNGPRDAHRRPWYTTHIVRDWIGFFLGAFLVLYDAVFDADHDINHSIALLTVGLVLMGFSSASRIWTWTRPPWRRPDLDDTHPHPTIEDDTT